MTARTAVPPRPHLRPPAQPASRGRRRHGFPRSHGPAEHEVKRIMVNASLPRRPQPGHQGRFRLPRHQRGRNARRTRKPQESRQIGERRGAGEPGAGASAAGAVPAALRSKSRISAPRAASEAEMPDEPESRRKPGESASVEAQASPASGSGARVPRARPPTLSSRSRPWRAAQPGCGRARSGPAGPRSARSRAPCGPSAVTGSSRPFTMVSVLRTSSLPRRAFMWMS